MADAHKPGAVVAGPPRQAVRARAGLAILLDGLTVGLWLTHSVLDRVQVTEEFSKQIPSACSRWLMRCCLETTKRDNTITASLHSLTSFIFGVEDLCLFLLDQTGIAPVSRTAV